MSRYQALALLPNITEETKILKKCTECSKTYESSREFFYSDRNAKSGLRGECKSCFIKKSVEYKKTENGRASKRREYAKNKDAYSERNKAWVDANRTLINDKHREFRENNKKIIHARDSIPYALKSGKLIRQPCFVCGCEKVDAHHADYDRPLDVTWLCRRHHRQLHSEFARSQELP